MKKLVSYLFLFIFFINFGYSSSQILGIVQDKYDNLIVGADLNFQCGEINNYIFPKKTNNYGSFELKNFTFNNCRIFASLENRIGYVDINNNGSNYYKINILIDKQAVVKISNNNLFFSFSSLLLLIFIIFILIYFYKAYIQNKDSDVLIEKTSENKKEIDILENKISKNSSKLEIIGNSKNNFEKDITNNKSEIRMTSFMAGIIETLNLNEKDIVETLIDLNGEATISKIRLKTGMPKTSVFRIINSLEKKKIISKENYGNMKKIKLTDFFIHNSIK